MSCLRKGVPVPWSRAMLIFALRQPVLTLHACLRNGFESSWPCCAAGNGINNEFIATSTPNRMLALPLLASPISLPWSSLIRARQEVPPTINTYVVKSHDYCSLHCAKWLNCAAGSPVSTMRHEESIVRPSASFGACRLCAGGLNAMSSCSSSKPAIDAIADPAFGIEETKLW